MKKAWWKEEVIYQIYPRSFKDSNGDGIGDINGIFEKLDYLKSLGVTTLWLNPIYKSPFDDMGYDISGYCEISEQYGTMEDFDRLLNGAHDRGIKIIMDLVVNHTSDEHPWFQEAINNPTSKYREYYIFKKPVSGSVPNNWRSYFSGSAWELNEKSGEYYLHLFTKKQPDLNWENPEVREEVKNLMRFWLDKGVDGFRMDVINLISKKPNFPDIDEHEIDLGKVYKNGPRLHEFLQELSHDVLSKYKCMSVGECSGASLEDALLICGEEREELQTLFHFEAMNADVVNNEFFKPGKYNFKEFKEIYERWHRDLYGKAWNSVYLMNHDQPRSLSRFGDDKNFHKVSGKLIATFVLTQWGTPYIYQGEEFGMTNCDFEEDEFKDVMIINYLAEQKALGKKVEELLPGIHYRARDNSRTPVQWNSQKNGGFSLAEDTWIKVNPNFERINAESQESDNSSILNYYREMIAFRKSSQTLIYGTQTEIEFGVDEVYAYQRAFEGEEILVILNFSEKNHVLEYDFSKYGSVMKSYGDIQIDEKQLMLRPYESVVLKK